MKKVSERRHNFSRNPVHILHIYRQTTVYISQRASRSAGTERESGFLNSAEMPKAIHPFPSKN